MKHHITTTTVFLNEENTLNDQIACEYLKFEIRKFSIHFSVSKAKKSNNNNNNNKKKNENFREKKRKLLKITWLTTNVTKTILNGNVI